MDTPGPMPGYDYSDMDPLRANWKKCWSMPSPKDRGDPYLILASDDKLWLVPDWASGRNIWGGDGRPAPTGGPGWLGPFETFEEGWATFILMLKE